MMVKNGPERRSVKKNVRFLGKLPKIRAYQQLGHRSRIVTIPNNPGAMNHAVQL